MNNDWDTLYREASIAFDSASLVGDAWVNAPAESVEEVTLKSVRDYLHDRGNIALEFCSIAHFAEIPF